MSDDGYDDYYYEEPQEEQCEEENIQTTLEFEICQAEQYIREQKFEDAVRAFTDIYNKASQHNVRTWKSKALQQLLELHVQMLNQEEIRNSLNEIKKSNQNDKLSEQSSKSIIKILISMQDKALYYSFWKQIFLLINQLQDFNIQAKCYFIMLEKEIKEKNKQKAEELYHMVIALVERIPKIQISSQLEFSYLEIMYLKLWDMNFLPQLRNLYIKLPYYEQDSSVNQSYISNIKEFIAPSLYEEENYVQCCYFMCGSFVENSKYGINNPKNRELLKINSLMVLLCEDQRILEDKQYNPMLQDCTASYKIEPDIQALFGLTEAYKNLDLPHFQQVMKIINLKLPESSPYADIENRVLLQLKKEKAASICRCYKTIKFDYLKKRIHEKSSRVLQKILLSLITSRRINGVIHLQKEYLEIRPCENTYYTTQLENLKDLTEKM